MTWLEIALVLWAVLIAVGLAWNLWEVVGLVRARRREKGGA